MKINWNMVNPDLLDNYQIPSCPTMFRKEAENIILILTRTQFEDYHTMTNFDKKMLYEYWRQIDGVEATLHDIHAFYEWLTTKATEPEKIRRARQWLIEHNFIIPKPNVSEHAQKAGDNWRVGVK
jgi:hypothetical protein